MSELFLNNFVIVYLFSEAILLIVTILLFLLDIKLIKFWDFNSFKPKQLKLEKSAYLVSTASIFLFTVKLTLLIYFVYLIDSLSIIIPGAMCGAGVISANGYGMNLLFVKLTVIFTLMLYLVLNNFDLKAKDYPLMKLKSWVLLIALILIFLENFLDVAYFFNIDLSEPVSCCSALFGELEGANPLPFGLDIKSLIILFYSLFVTSVLSMLIDNKIVSLITLILFGIVAYYAVVYFFGTYIYELPTHKCPFCMMQKEYHYIGYFVWGTLFFGLFFGLIWVIIEFLKLNGAKYRAYSILLLTILVLICSAYVGIYYLKNGVFL